MVATPTWIVYLEPVARPRYHAHSNPTTKQYSLLLGHILPVMDIESCLQILRIYVTVRHRMPLMPQINMLHATKYVTVCQ